jgi:mannan endo-1,4-beta-mannosidase
VRLQIKSREEEEERTKGTIETKMLRSLLMLSLSCVVRTSFAAQADFEGTLLNLISNEVKLNTCLKKNMFVRVNGAQFEIDDEPFIFAGWNQWEVVEAASDAPPPYRWTPKLGVEHLVKQLDVAVETGLKVARIWVHPITDTFALRPTKTTWNERALKGLDFFLSECGKRDVKVVIVLADNWYKTGGIAQYCEWSRTCTSQADFFTDAEAQKYYKETINYLAYRTNTITKIAYREDPTIMAWNLANEARAKGRPSSEMKSWIEDSCKYLKKHAPNHLVAVGYEGFSDDSRRRDAGFLNPGKGGGRWAGQEGQDFLSQVVESSCIDYAGIHVWPDAWDVESTEFQKEFITNRANLVGKTKPFVLEEFGIIVGKTPEERKNDMKKRDMYFKNAFDTTESLAKDKKISGTMFWHFYDEGVGPGRFGVRTSDESTWALITKHAKFMAQLSGLKTSCVNDNTEKDISVSTASN